MDDDPYNRTGFSLDWISASSVTIASGVSSILTTFFLLLNWTFKSTFLPVFFEVTLNFQNLELRPIPGSYDIQKVPILLLSISKEGEIDVYRKSRPIPGKNEVSGIRTHDLPILRSTPRPLGQTVEWAPRFLLTYHSRKSQKEQARARLCARVREYLLIIKCENLPLIKA